MTIKSINILDQIRAPVYPGNTYTL